MYLAMICALPIELEAEGFIEAASKLGVGNKKINVLKQQHGGRARTAWFSSNRSRHDETIGKLQQLDFVHVGGCDRVSEVNCY
mmetsp:Transcript_91493/g.191255  ORF Transcript_91493/g.191255 Transcript_91493/m.191255 type:complete len:83 (-) Transcript_91493:33-281(-)